MYPDRNRSRLNFQGYAHKVKIKTRNTQKRTIFLIQYTVYKEKLIKASRLTRLSLIVRADRNYCNSCNFLMILPLF